MAGAPPAQARPDAPSIRQLVERLVRAQRGVNLRGWLTVVSSSPRTPSRTTVNRVVRRADGSSLTICQGPGPGKGNVSEERDGWVKRYDAQTHTVTINRALPVERGEKAIRRDVARILRNYRVTLSDTEIHGGRTFYHLCADPYEPAGRPVEVLMDAATGAERWRLESDRAGNTLGLTTFTDVEYPPSIPPSAVRHTYPKEARRAQISRSPMLRSIRAVRQAAGFEVHLPGYLPRGYEFEHGTVVEVSGRRIACLIYGDGLANLTVSQIKPTPGRARGFRQCRVIDLPLGEVMAYYARESLNIQVVGHLDPQALALIAESIDPERERRTLQALTHRFGASAAELARLRDRGMGLDALAALAVMRRQTGRSLSALAARLADGDDWRTLASRLHIPAEQVIRSCRILQAP